MFFFSQHVVVFSIMPIYSISMENFFRNLLFHSHAFFVFFFAKWKFSLKILNSIIQVFVVDGAMFDLKIEYIKLSISSSVHCLDYRAKATSYCNYPYSECSESSESSESSKQSGYYNIKNNNYLLLRHTSCKAWIRFLFNISFFFFIYLFTQRYCRFKIVMPRFPVWNWKKKKIIK